jgi:cytochrome c-type biogenesis protein CcmE
MTHEQLWSALRLAQEPVPAVVVGAWGLLGAVIAIFIVRFRSDWRAGVKAAAALVAASVALGYLVWRARQDPTVHYKRVGDVVANPESARGRRLLVHGYVNCGSIQHRVGTDDYRFEIQHLPWQPDVTLEVRYTGLVPDTFVQGNEVIVSGTLSDAGVLDAVPDGIRANCGNMLPINRCETQPTRAIDAR